MADYIHIHPRDNVSVSLSNGHKTACACLQPGDAVIKYGLPIGHATAAIGIGEQVHTHNMATNLKGTTEFTYQPDYQWPAPQTPATFLGYRRANGQVGIRNEIWIIPTVGCVNDVAKALADSNQHLVTGNIDGLYAFQHPYGCSQTGADHARTAKILANLAQHGNAGAVLILGLGCENLTKDEFFTQLGDYDPNRVQYLSCQSVPDEMAAGRECLARCAQYAAGFAREPIDASQLVVGMKCGGSDGFSGITANPVVGAFSDQLIAQGGSTLLTEVPEMFGAEQLLLNRCIDRTVFSKAATMVDDFRAYYLRHGESIADNPSPGNHAGGITTLEEKSCGCVQKGGTAPITDVLAYGDRVRRKGLQLLSGPGNDLVSTTALTAAGCHLILFTTGRGTPFGAPAPTIKIASNHTLAQQKPGWIDFDASVVMEGIPTGQCGEDLMALVLAVASGKQTRTEIMGYRSIAIFKDGVTL